MPCALSYPMILRLYLSCKVREYLMPWGIWIFSGVLCTLNFTQYPLSIGNTSPSSCNSVSNPEIIPELSTRSPLRQNHYHYEQMITPCAKFVHFLLNNWINFAGIAIFKIYKFRFRLNLYLPCGDFHFLPFLQNSATISSDNHTLSLENVHE